MPLRQSLRAHAHNKRLWYYYLLVLVLRKGQVEESAKRNSAWGGINLAGESHFYN